MYVYVFSVLELTGFWFMIDAFCDPILDCFDYKGLEGLWCDIASILHSDYYEMVPISIMLLVHSR